MGKKNKKIQEFISPEFIDETDDEDHPKSPQNDDLAPPRPTKKKKIKKESITQDHPRPPQNEDLSPSSPPTKRKKIKKDVFKLSEFFDETDNNEGHVDEDPRPPQNDDLAPPPPTKNKKRKIKNDVIKQDIPRPSQNGDLTPPPPTKNKKRKTKKDVIKQDFSCSFCSEKFLDENSHLEHILTHYKVNYVCQFCQESFRKMKKLRKHINRAHLEASEISSECSQVLPDLLCSVCSEKFLDQNSLSEHCQEHYKINYTCEFCQKSFKKMKKLHKHIKNAHLDVKNSQSTQKSTEPSSPGPSKKAKLKPNKKSGNKCESSSINFNTCSICSKFFKRNVDLTRHTLVHFKHNPFQCQLCPRGFKQESNLKHHVKKIHCGVDGNSEPQPFRCSICKFPTPTFLQLREHLDKNHRGENPHECFTCMKRYKNQRDLLRHEKTHFNVKFECHLCPTPKPFTRKDTLDRHISIFHDRQKFLNMERELAKQKKLLTEVKKE